jgi:hypothetical protein
MLDTSLLIGIAFGLLISIPIVAYRYRGLIFPHNVLKNSAGLADLGKSVPHTRQTPKTLPELMEKMGAKRILFAILLLAIILLAGHDLMLQQELNTGVVGPASPETSTPTVSLSLTATSSTQPFDFELTTNSGNTVNLCYTSAGWSPFGQPNVKISVVLLSGEPQPVTLSYESLPPGIASVSFSENDAAPPFNSIVHLSPGNHSPFTGLEYFTVRGAASGITRSVVIRIVFQSCGGNV